MTTTVDTALRATQADFAAAQTALATLGNDLSALASAIAASEQGNANLLACSNDFPGSAWTLQRGATFANGTLSLSSDPNSALIQNVSRILQPNTTYTISGVFPSATGSFLLGCADFGTVNANVTLSASSLRQSFTFTTSGSIGPGANVYVNSAGSAVSLTLQQMKLEQGPTMTAYVGDTDCPAVVAAFYVSLSGNDANDGLSPSTPFATLEKAQSAMQASSTIKTTYIRAGTYSRSSSITLGSADNGTTWSHYPVDGVNSATLDGQTVTSLVRLNGGLNGLTINGLKLINGKGHNIDADNGGGGPSGTVFNVTVTNCDSGFNFNDGSQGGFPANLFFGNINGLTVTHNYVHDCPSFGIATGTFLSGDVVDNVLIDSNVVLRAVQSVTDGGGIAIGDHGLFFPIHATISNNYVKDCGNTGVGGVAGIYLDDNTSGVTVTGNVVGPLVQSSGSADRQDFEAFEIHNGHDNHITNNIVDVGNGGAEQIALYFQDGASVAGMGGNAFTNNIVVCNFAVNAHTQSGNAFSQNSAGTNFTIQNNIYFNYGGGQILTSGTTQSDSNPTISDPLLSGYTYQLAATSPAFSAPINFTRIVGGWGPPGFTIPRTGEPPSCPH